MLPTPFTSLKSIPDDSRMVPGLMTIEGRRMRYAVSANSQQGKALLAETLEAKRQRRSPNLNGIAPSDEFVDDDTWFINIHGYFAGGGMYWRESSKLVKSLGVKVLNPSLPGFGGSDALPWEELSMKGFARRVVAIMDRLRIKRAVLLGHSMGGAVAIQIASDFPNKVTGIIYRDGAGTPSWKDRDGIIVKVFAPIVPDLAAVLDLGSAALLDLPDILLGRMNSTLRALLPDLQRNVRSLGRTIPAAAMLFGSDLSGEVSKVGNDIPILGMWGILDKITPPKTASEFSDIGQASIVWVPGGHSWMLARPATQSWVLRYHEKGCDFLERTKERENYLSSESHPANHFAKITQLRR